MVSTDDVINNYVFQNKYKEYFSNELYKVKNAIDTNVALKKYKTICYNITGVFNEKERVISFPNIFTYAYSAVKLLENTSNNFGRLENSKYNTMKIDFKKRKFQSNSYSQCLENKTNLLLNKYEYMYKIDIQNFYNRIYTHVFEKLEHGDESIDKYVRLYNNNKTNSLLLGNILSTLSANEIMEDMCEKIEREFKMNSEESELKNCKIEYFSDQFYIYFNQENLVPKILSIVKNVIGKSYFEFEINNNDSMIYNHEKIITFRKFNKDLDSLYDLQNINRSEKQFFKYCDADYSNNKMSHFFNALIDKYYKTETKKRKAFVEVALKRVFSSSINLFRLQLLLDTSTDTDNVSKRCIEILFMILKKHPELIITYIHLGIWYIIENSQIYKKENLYNEYKNIYYQLLIKNKNNLNSIYYFHIYYLLNKRFTNHDKKKNMLKDYEEKIKNCNYILDAIIAATFKPKVTKKEILKMTFSQENWLVEYTNYLNSRYYNHENNTICKTAKAAKKEGVQIVKSLDEIICSADIIKKIKERQKTFEYKRKKSQQTTPET